MKLLSAALLALLAACASAPRPQASFQPLSFVAVGDTGYHYDYLEAEDYAARRSIEDLLRLEREDWIEDGLPPEEFVQPPMHRLDRTGGMVVASGQKPVAKAMNAFCKISSCDFVAMLGDNIYPDGATLGADGREDAARFDNMFVEPFGGLGAARKDFAIYVTLGNHDWHTSRAGAEAQVGFLRRTSPFYMHGLFYRVSPPAGRGEVELFVIDTHMMLAGSIVYTDKLGPDGKELASEEIEEYEPWARPQTEAERGMALWLEQALRSSQARWKIVMGHHPLWSTAGGKFEQARVLRRLILPALCRYADAYLAGHDHTLEVHTDDCSQALGKRSAAPPLLHVVSGAGSKQRPVHRAFMHQQQKGNPQLRTVFAKGMTWGFAHLTLESGRVVVRLVSTPNDGGGTLSEELVYEHPRRSSPR